MVHVSPTERGGVSHVFCDVDWWGEEVPTDQANEIAVEHETTQAHIDAEVEQETFENAAELARIERGH